MDTENVTQEQYIIDVSILNADFLTQLVYLQTFVRMEGLSSISYVRGSCYS